ncbi:MAG: response regulator [Pseudobutyrivibrio sp.]|nr:response regulator [Pseudobutyrivibrio sp.]
MYKVVIVDDEPVICQGLQQTVKWDEFNCQVSGVANDGKEGLKVIKDVKPDIVFSDIAMNTMDGLTMVAAIKSEFPNIEVTLLTGYRNFDYAKEAVNLGVRRFLLKPSKMSELTEAIEAMVSHLKLAESNEDTPSESQESFFDLSDEREAFIYNFFLKENMDGLSEANLFIVKKALLYIYDNYNQKLTLTQVAEYCYVSSWHLSKLLNQAVGHGFLDIINLIRLEKAKVLLGDGTRKVQDVAEMVGFMDVAHFSRSFKTYTGISPKEYRIW